MRRTGRIEVSPKRIACEYPTRRMWKQFLKSKLAELATLTEHEAKVQQGSSPHALATSAEAPIADHAYSKEDGQRKGIDKSALSLPEPRRIRDRKHVRAVTQLPCLVCGRQPSDPHHLRFAQSRALSRRASDEFTVPLCRGHHREVHRCGDEAEWWRRQGIDAVGVARALWLEFSSPCQTSWFFPISQYHRRRR